MYEIIDGQRRCVDLIEVQAQCVYPLMSTFLSFSFIIHHSRSDFSFYIKPHKSDIQSLFQLQSSHSHNVEKRSLDGGEESQA